MKILISSHFFYPSIGGLERVSETLAREFVRQSHEVKLITHTSSSGATRLPFKVDRKPKTLSLLKLLNWCDIYFHSNVSLRTAWPLLFIRKPWVVRHAVWIPRNSGLKNWRGYLKRFILRYATCISISNAIAGHFSTPSVVIPNPYDGDIFYQMPEIPRDKDLVFVGRLVSDKGVHLLLEALAKLKMQGHILSLTVVGGGPEEIPLRRIARKFGVYDQVYFAGIKQGKELTALINAHQVMVVPSLWEEPFGVVALEGIACGCVVVGSEGGGLRDAIGRCGVTFPNGDVEALAKIVADLFSNPDKMEVYRAQATMHLLSHTKATVAGAYLQIFIAAYEGRKYDDIC
ncbi:D-inositol-3-phosphate glycosyltransferase [subsurface metagenome]